MGLHGTHICNFLVAVMLNILPEMKPQDDTKVSVFNQELQGLTILGCICAFMHVSMELGVLMPTMPHSNSEH